MKMTKKNKFENQLPKTNRFSIFKLKTVFPGFRITSLLTIHDELVSVKSCVVNQFNRSHRKATAQFHCSIDISCACITYNKNKTNQITKIPNFQTTPL